MGRFWLEGGTMPRNTTQSEERPLLVAAAECETERRVLFRRVLLKQKLQARIVNDLVVLMEYIAHCGGLSAEGCKAYVQTYANKLQLPVRTASTRLKILRELGFIQTQPRKDRSSLTWLNLEVIQEQANRVDQSTTALSEARQTARNPKAGDGNFGSHVTAGLDLVTARVATGDGKSCRLLVSSHSSIKSPSSNFPWQTEEKKSLPVPSRIQTLGAAEGSAWTPPLTAAGISPDHIWKDLARQLAALGLIDVQPAITLARSRGLCPAHVQTLIEHYRDHAGAWEPGYLCYRLKNDWPGRSPLEGWPPASERFQQHRRQQQYQEKCDQAAERQRDHLARRQQLQQELEQTQARLARWQPRLNNLSRSDVREILLQHHPPEQAAFLASLGLENQDLQLAVCEVWEAESEVPV